MQYSTLEKYHLIEWFMGLGSLFGLTLGLWHSSWLLVGIAGVGIVYVLQSILAGFRALENSKSRSARQTPESTTGYGSGLPHNTSGSSDTEEEVQDRAPVVRKTPSEPTDMDGLVEEMFSQERYALLLRQQIAENLTNEQLRRAIAALEDGMALVPEGSVWLQQPRYETQDNVRLPNSQEGGRLINIDPVFLDRFPVTNRQFQIFLDSGGYGEMALWDPEIWPGVIDFVDRSGLPGPRFWSEGSYPPGSGEHPVVGVSWYEASAYARWLGKRLPNDPEWVKAGCWPVTVPGSLPLQRKYPWGDSMDLDNANLWATDLGGTAPVTAFESGMSVGGVYQLIGNVWEWTNSWYGEWHVAQEKIEAGVSMRSVRGGSYDTYFDNHASCHFQSGESPVARKHNVGFRCSLGMCDLAPIKSIVSQSDSEEVAAATVEV